MPKEDDEDFWLNSSRRQALQSNRRLEEKLFRDGWRRNTFGAVLVVLTVVAYLILR